jgi:uncharacterized repeat protein (TIGR01451 family)
MATIENFATVSYTSGGVTETKVSNLAEIGLNSAVSLSKTILGNTYGENAILTYILTAINTSSSEITNIVITDDLGSFTVGTAELTPLTYTPPALLLIDGIDSSATLSVDSSIPSSLTFSFPSLPAGATANIVYRATVNDFAPLDLGSTITNTATFESDSDCADGTASANVTVAEAANVSVFKQMSPNPVVCGDLVTYTIRIYNYGNIPAENVQLTDNFDPAPTNITVSRDGTVLNATDYTYENGLLTIPATDTQNVSVPAATFVRDPDSGVVSVIPGMIEYVITGRI